MSVVGFNVKSTSEGGSIVSAALTVTPPNAALMVGVVTVPTGLLVTVNVALLAPAGMVTFAGT
jgi:hypothetical protein